jgi:signal transduction histidine kinase
MNSVACNEEVRGARGPVIADLHERMRRVARRLPGGGDVQATLSEAFHVLGAGLGVQRLVLAAGGDEDPKVLAAQPGPVVSLDAHARIAALVHEVYAVGEAVLQEPAEVGDGAGPETSRARYAVPLYGDGRPVAVLVGEGAPRVPLTEADEVAVETMAVVLTPLLLVRRDLEASRDLDRLRSDFISRVSHELRTPLTIITGFAGTLGAHEDTLTPEQRHAMLDRIVSASVRLEHLVEEVLSLASVEAGLADPRPLEVPVIDVVDLAIHDRGGTGRVEVTGPVDLRIVTDPEVARVVLGALVENALQQGEHVTVSFEPVEAGVRVGVQDDGPGVPPELGSRVFERFVRGDDRSPGMGLGLAIARRMAEAIGARIWLDEVPRGARFIVELPTMRSPAQSP